MLRQYICEPLVDVELINEYEESFLFRRLNAVDELRASSCVNKLRDKLKTLPDLERNLSALNSLGCLSTNHPDARAVMVEEMLYLLK